LIVHKSLNVSLPVIVPNEDIIKVVEYLLQNTTPMPRVEIIGGNIYTTRNRRFSCRLPLPVWCTNNNFRIILNNLCSILLVQYNWCTLNIWFWIYWYGCIWYWSCFKFKYRPFV